MSLRKRGSVWWVDFVSPSGERVRRSTETGNKALAQELHDKLKADAWRLSKLEERPRRTWNDAVVKWAKESHKKSLNDDIARFRWLDKFLGGKYLETINRALVDRIVDAKLAEGVSNATANRLVALIRAVLRKCEREWEWLDKAPAFRMRKEPSRRIRYLTQEEARRLLGELPEHMSDMAAFSLATGLRQANVTGMQWSQVDLSRGLAWVHPDQAKAKRAIAVPLNAEAVKLISKQLGKHESWVFTFRGKPITQVSTKAWYAALERAGISDFRWHDLRHTWASWHVQNGTPLFALQELGGWESPEMVRRYAHLSADHLAPYARRLASLTETDGTNPSQPENEKG
jgi:integrase